MSFSRNYNEKGKEMANVRFFPVHKETIAIVTGAEIKRERKVYGPYHYGTGFDYQFKGRRG